MTRRPAYVGGAVVILACLAVLAIALSLNQNDSTPPSTGVALAEAVEIARAAVPERSPASQANGRQLQYLELSGLTALDPEPQPDAWFWLINVFEGQEGTWVVIALDGTVLRVIPWIG